MHYYTETRKDSRNNQQQAHAFIAGSVTSVSTQKKDVWSFILGIAVAQSSKQHTTQNSHHDTNRHAHIAAHVNTAREKNETTG